MKKSDKTFHILYVDDSTPKLKTFKSRDAADKFIAKFRADPENSHDNGYWIDLYFQGVIFEKDEYFGR